MNHQLFLLLNLSFLVLRHSTIARLSNDRSPYFVSLICIMQTVFTDIYKRGGFLCCFVMLYKSLKMRICPNFPDTLV